MKKKICLLLAVAMLLLSTGAMAADNEQNSSENTDSGYSQNNECQGDACTWKR